MSDLIIILLLIFILLGGLYVYNELDDNEPVVVTKTEYVPQEIPVPYWNIPTRYPTYEYPLYGYRRRYGYRDRYGYPSRRIRHRDRKGSRKHKEN
jgi:hypothetical protein